MALRVGGLASGMDIESIVKDLMRAERMPLDKLQQDKQLLEWKQEDYRDINQQVFKLRDAVFDMKLQGTFSTKQATSSDESTVQVSAGSNAVAGTYELAVSNIAKGAFKTSTADTAAYTAGATLKEQFFAGSTDTTAAFTINDVEFTFDVTQDSVYDVVNEINSYKDIDGNDLGVTASYDADLKRFFLMTDETGVDQQIEVIDTQNVDGSALMGDALHINATVATGQDAQFTLNGASLSKTTNKFTINGVTYDLKGINDTDANGSPVATISITNDTDAVFDKIKSFVETYNETLELITDKTQEKRYRDYRPLTEEQKEDMTDNQIEIWEEKARSGLLKSDSIVRDIVSDFRMAMSGIVENISGEFGSLVEIGISTQNWYENGKLHIDEADLKEALNKDSQGVMDLFTNNSEVDNEKGVAVKLYDAVIHSSELITDKAGRASSYSLVDNSYIGKRLSNMSDEINAWEDRLTNVEDRYWRQFTRMEEAINRMNSQSAWLSQQFGVM